MLRREAAHLREVFERALLVSSVAAIGACSPSNHETPDAASSSDAMASGRTDAGTPTDATGDSDAGFSWPLGCQPAPPVVYDASADAPNCVYRVTLPCGLPSFVTAIDQPQCTMSLSECINLCTGAAFPFL